LKHSIVMPAGAHDDTELFVTVLTCICTPSYRGFYSQAQYLVVSS
jgi:hypothetical protein